MPFFKLGGMETKKEVPLVPKCQSCLYYRSCKNPKLRLQGRGKLPILIVSGSVEASEDDQGKLFIDTEGIAIKNAFAVEGIDIRDCWLTKAVICNRDGKYNKKEVDDCRANLLQTIEEVNPNVIILIGRKATASLMNFLWKDNLEEGWYGKKVPCARYNAWVCPISSYRDIDLYSNRVLRLKQREWLRTAIGLAEQKPFRNKPDYKSKVRCLWDSREVIQELKRIKANQETVAYDYETNCLKPDHPSGKIVCASVGWKEGAISFFMNDQIEEAWIEFLVDSNVKKIGQNHKFENRWNEAKYGVWDKGCFWDNNLSAALLDGTPGTNSLKFQAFIYLGQEDYNSTIAPYLEGEGGHGLNRVHEINDKQLLTYCGMDSYLEYLLYKKHLRDIEIEQEKWSKLYGESTPAS